MEPESEEVWPRPLPPRGSATIGPVGLPGDDPLMRGGFVANVDLATGQRIVSDPWYARRPG
jgi:hypothetical protein